MKDHSIMGVAIVLAGQIQVELSLKMLKAGKHVIQASRQHQIKFSGVAAAAGTWAANCIGGLHDQEGQHGCRYWGQYCIQQLEAP